MTLLPGTNFCSVLIVVAKCLTGPRQAAEFLLSHGVRGCSPPCVRVQPTMGGEALQSLWQREDEVKGFSFPGSQEAEFAGWDQGWV